MMEAASPRAAALRLFAVGLTAFFTLVDLFGAQAILPALAQRFHTSPATTSLAVNASTLGMAIAGLLVAFFSRGVDRRRAISLSLALLAVPTAALALAPNLAVFAALRVTQGLCMATAFGLMLAYLGEHFDMGATAGAFAAYVTGNVASNLFGRLIAATTASALGIPTTFLLLAALNLAGAALVYFTVRGTPPMPGAAMASRSLRRLLAEPLSDARTRALLVIGFSILFAFIGVFSFVNFVLARRPFALGMMSLGLVYFVFLPSILVTPLGGTITRIIGGRRALWLGLMVAVMGLPLLLLPALAAVLGGLVLVGVGTFLAQAVATGQLAVQGKGERGATSGLYLAAYFTGGLVGTAVLGQVFDRLGWRGCVLGVFAALVCAALAAFTLAGSDRARSLEPGRAKAGALT